MKIRASYSRRRRGFTLIEIMVVLAIVAILSSITVGTFRSISDGNKRTSCQSNLAQIYQSCRLYAQDYNGKYPYFNSDITGQAATPSGGIGLWNLYIYPKAGSSNCTGDVPDLPLAADSSTILSGYVRSPKIFHCPSDSYNRPTQYRTSSTACSTIQVDSGSLAFSPTGTVSYLNPAYMSYQIQDDVPATVGSPVLSKTYATFRTNLSGTRQITVCAQKNSVNFVPDLPTPTSTVVAWCKFHRSLDKDGNTVTSRRNYDNVLFSDGSVQTLPMAQDVTDAGGNAGTCYAWRRVPRELANSLSQASSCNLG